jgi:hypothetical protein
MLSIGYLDYIALNDRMTDELERIWGASGLDIIKEL